MKISGGLSEKGVVVGNSYDKYHSGNPLVRRIMRGFESSLLELLDIASPATVHEVGCGEGYWVIRWLKQGLDVRGSDFSEVVIELAKGNAREQQLPSDIFRQQSIYDLQADEDSADLLVCCEVLEHLEEPEIALRVLQKIASRHIILSVPREPVWSILNMARGKYWSDLGNTPGHIQRWSSREFADMVSTYFNVQEKRSPLPWTMLLCTAKDSSVS